MRAELEVIPTDSGEWVYELVLDHVHITSARWFPSSRCAEVIGRRVAQEMDIKIHDVTVLAPCRLEEE